MLKFQEKFVRFGILRTDIASDTGLCREILRAGLSFEAHLELFPLSMLAFLCVADQTILV